jgi:hypothetical protein
MASGHRGGDAIDLYRAVSAAELSDIMSSGMYRILPGGVEGKYFTLSLPDARYFRDQAIIGADSIVRSSVASSTFNGLDHGVFDYRPGVFADTAALPAVNSDALRYGGISRVE